MWFTQSIRVKQSCIHGELRLSRDSKELENEFELVNVAITDGTFANFDGIIAAVLSKTENELQLVNVTVVNSYNCESRLNCCAVHLDR